VMSYLPILDILRAWLGVEEGASPGLDSQRLTEMP